MEALEDGDAVTPPAQLTRRGEAGRTGADNGDSLPGCGEGEGKAPTLLEGVVDGEPLEGADGNRRKTEAVVEAMPFAELLLRADSPADPGENVVFSQNRSGALEVPSLDVLDEGGNANLHRAPPHTGGGGAIEATGGFEKSLLARITGAHLGKVFEPLFHGAEGKGNLEAGGSLLCRKICTKLFSPEFLSLPTVLVEGVLLGRDILGGFGDGGGELPKILGLHSGSQALPIDLPDIEGGTLQTGEAETILHTDPATSAHPRPIEHENVEGSLAGNLIGGGFMGDPVHHFQRAREEEALKTLSGANLFEESLTGTGEAGRAIVGGREELQGEALKAVGQEKFLSLWRRKEYGNPVSFLEQFLG